MRTMASQITSLTIVHSSVYSGVDQRKHQSPASLAFVRRIHRWPVNSPHKGPVTWKMFPFDDVIMMTLLQVFFALSLYTTHFPNRFTCYRTVICNTMDHLCTNIILQIQLHTALSYNFDVVILVILSYFSKVYFYIQHVTRIESNVPTYALSSYRIKDNNLEFIVVNCCCSIILISIWTEHYTVV